MNLHASTLTAIILALTHGPSLNCAIRSLLLDVFKRVRYTCLLSYVAVSCIVIKAGSVLSTLRYLQYSVFSDHCGPQVIFAAPSRGPRPHCMVRIKCHMLNKRMNDSWHSDITFKIVVGKMVLGCKKFGNHWLMFNSHFQSFRLIWAKSFTLNTWTSSRNEGQSDGGRQRVCNGGHLMYSLLNYSYITAAEFSGGSCLNGCQCSPDMNETSRISQMTIPCRLIVSGNKNTWRSSFQVSSWLGCCVSCPFLGISFIIWFLSDVDVHSWTILLMSVRRKAAGLDFVLGKNKITLDYIFKRLFSMTRLFWSGLVSAASRTCALSSHVTNSANIWVVLSAKGTTCHVWQCSVHTLCTCIPSYLLS